MTAVVGEELMTPAKLEAAFRAIGAERYHHRHPFHQLMHEHAGDGIQPGGIEKWIQLAVAAGLDRDEVISEKGILPATRYAVNAYLDLVSKHSFLEAVASSLTEMFSRDLIALRTDRLRQHYPWLSGGLAYL